MLYSMSVKWKPKYGKPRMMTLGSPIFASDLVVMLMLIRGASSTLMQEIAQGYVFRALSYLS